MYKDIPNIEEMREYSFEKSRPIEASVIIATYAPRKNELSACLNGLQQQSIKNFEVVLVENGSNHFIEKLAGDLQLRYIGLDRNDKRYGVTIARNIGSYFARSELLIFLEDDGVPAPDFVESHIRSYDRPDIIGVRGKYVPVSDRHNPYTSGCYDLGTETIPALLNIEGNCSVKRSRLIDAGGWSTPIYAHQGIALTYELTQGGKLYDRVIYNPKAIVFHDNNKTITRTLYLTFIRRQNLARLELVYPDIKPFIRTYQSGRLIDRRKKKLVQQLSLGNLRKLVLFYLHSISGLIGEKYAKISRLADRDTDPGLVDLSFFEQFSPQRRF